MWATTQGSSPFSSFCEVPTFCAVSFDTVFQSGILNHASDTIRISCAYKLIYCRAGGAVPVAPVAKGSALRMGCIEKHSRIVRFPSLEESHHESKSSEFGDLGRNGRRVQWCAGRCGPVRHFPSKRQRKLLQTRSEEVLQASPEVLQARSDEVLQAGSSQVLQARSEMLCPGERSLQSSARTEGRRRSRAAC